MRYLRYTNYESGNSGLSNAVMSIEVGVGLAFLTNRFLVLEGNVSPPANVVSYGGRVETDRPSRVTDLIDLPVPWGEPGDVDLAGLEARELTDENLGQLVLYFPSTLDITSDDARNFARGRTTWVHPAGALADVPVLEMTEQPAAPGGEPQRGERKRNNLSFYGYTFYLDDEHRRSLYRVYERMRPKPELAALAQRVAADLGRFNAVHLRRGDFKLTYGVTTLDRQPWEAIEAMDALFARDDTLVVLTDDRDDPFFEEIRAAYPRHVFIDHHILDDYGADFAALPARDSIALAYLSQLIAAESQAFIGTMTSTFTALIQRYRGNRGHDEHFRFLWNELPQPDDPVERGRHPISECVPLERGRMVEEFDGPYSWNRVNQRLAPAWMREWPESLLSEQVLATGALPGRSARSAGVGAPATPLRKPELQRSTSVAHPASAATSSGGERSRLVVPFAGVEVAIHVRSQELTEHLAACFGVDRTRKARHAVAELAVTGFRPLILERDGQQVAEAADNPAMVETVQREIARVLCTARPRHSWLAGAAFVRSGRALVVAGHPGAEAEGWASAMGASGWDLLGDGWIPILHPSRQVLPFGRTTWPQGSGTGSGRASGRASGPPKPEPAPLATLVVAHHRLTARDEIRCLSPSVAVAELIASSLDFSQARKKAVERLCKLVAEVPVLHASFSDGARGAALIEKAEKLIEAREEKTA
ncbi:MAG: O-fucosyltransferase family protein [Acidobacteriota bacterium]